MKIVAATNNANKLAEIRRILAPLGHEAITMREAGVTVEPEETGETFRENAIIKAETVCGLCGLPTLADDSGLCVDALDGAPGVRSARFAGDAHDDEANNDKLLRLLETVPYAKRTARFVSVIAFRTPEDGGFETEGVCEGRIGFSREGAGGFGYDPLFVVGDETFASMADGQKDAISHRARALRAFAEELARFCERKKLKPPEGTAGGKSGC